MAKLIWIFFFFFCSYCEGYRILVVYPFRLNSHNTLGLGIVRNLLKAGHEVTYVSPFDVKDPNPNFTLVHVKENDFSGFNISKLLNKEQDVFRDEIAHFEMIFRGWLETFDRQAMKDFLNDPKQRFDAVIVEWMFTEVMTGLGAIFQCPLIWVLPYEPFVNNLRLIDEAPNPAYIPHLGNEAPRTFWRRVYELVSQTYSIFLKEFVFYYMEKERYESIFTEIAARKGISLPPYDEIRFNASLMLSCTHVALGSAMRVPKNLKFIGGHFIDENVKPLPNDLKKIMDNAKHGVIYFSMGSVLKSKELDKSIQDGLVKTFGELKETVIWKYEGEFPNLPNNLHVVKWAPQQSILAHPNCKLFITHGGLLSTTETVHFGVPIIGIPVIVDQFNNVDTAVRMGYAKRVDLTHQVADDLKVAIQEVRGDPKYAKRAKDLSQIYHDRPISPARELVHWVEHVVRTRGARHLRSPALDVPFYQKMYIDLVSVVLIVYILARKLVGWMYLQREDYRLKKKVQ